MCMYLVFYLQYILLHRNPVGCVGLLGERLWIGPWLSDFEKETEYENKQKKIPLATSSQQFSCKISESK